MDAVARLQQECEECRGTGLSVREYCPSCGSPPRKGEWTLSEAFSLLDEARAERDALLAIIHRDGGHHTGAVGVTQSVADAHEAWGRVVAERDELRFKVTAAWAERDEARDALKARLDGAIDRAVWGDMAYADHEKLRDERDALRAERDALKDKLAAVVADNYRWRAEAMAGRAWDDALWADEPVTREACRRIRAENEKAGLR